MLLFIKQYVIYANPNIVEKETIKIQIKSTILFIYFFLFGRFVDRKIDLQIG